MDFRAHRRIIIVALLAVVALGVMGRGSSQDGASETPPIASAQIDSSSTLPSVSTMQAKDEWSAPSLLASLETQYTPLPVFTHVPPSASARQPLQVVIALHGVGSEGKGFSASLINEADRRGWLLMAPTIKYGDWHSPEQVTQEDIENTQRLLATINNLSAQMGLSIKPRVYLYGFSRGAQFAHRFALFFPEHVDRVAAFSAGTYTLPYKTMDIQGDGHRTNVALPYGVGDLAKHLGRPMNPARLKQVRFYIGVGAADNSANDVPRQWDPYLGRTRVERAREFVSAMQNAGVSCSLHVFPGAGHEVTPQMLTQAVQFLSNDDAPVRKSLAN